MSITRRKFVEAASLGAAFGSILPTTPFAGRAQGAEDAGAAGHKAKIIDLDDRVGFAQQLAHDAAPVVLMSTFLVAPEDVDDFLAGFKKQFAIMRKQPGLISAQLHRGIAGSCLFMNYVVWETVAHFKRGHELPEFQARLKSYPASTVVTVNFFQRVAIEGMCLGEGTVAG